MLKNDPSAKKHGDDESSAKKHGEKTMSKFKRVTICE